MNDFSAIPPARAAEASPAPGRKWLYGAFAAVVFVLVFAGVVSRIGPAPPGTGAEQTEQPRVAGDRTDPAMRAPAAPAPAVVPEFAKSIATPSGAMTLISGEKPYYIDTYEATNRLYRRFTEASGRAFPPNPPWDRRYSSKPDYPVMNMTFEDAAEFCAWAGKRLPSPPEWEKAALGTDGRRFPWGNFTAEGVANWKAPADTYPNAAPVGSFPFDFSPYGVLDVAGNVPEWVADRSVRGGWFGMRSGDYTMKPDLPRGPFSPAGIRCAIDAGEASKLLTAS